MPKKRKQKEPEVELSDSDDGDLSAVTTKPLKKKKQQPNIPEAPAQPTLKVAKTKVGEISTLERLKVDPKPQPEQTP